MVNYIVSGCPRSGTSMTMRILAKAGMPIASDGERTADNDNVHGYFEVASIVDKIIADPSVVLKYDGQVLKVIHFGIKHFPPGDYKIIYIDRDLDEVMMSMEKMMGEPDPDRQATKDAFASFAEKVKSVMAERGDMEVLYVNHRDLVTDPSPVIDSIIEFYGIDPGKKDDMMSAIDPKQYRNRSSQMNSPDSR
ncbi:sulfotransferase domain-containing protein [Candidatus Altiarchaeota archaeon]